MQPVIASNGVSYLQMRSVGSHNTSGREKEGNKERTGREPDRSTSKTNIISNKIGIRIVIQSTLDRMTYFQN